MLHNLRGFMFDPRVFYFLGALSLVSLMAWALKPCLGTQIFVYGFLPFSVLSSSLFVSNELSIRRIPDVYDRAGIFARQYLSNKKNPGILAVGTNQNGMFRTMFQLDNPAASMRTTAEIDTMANSAEAKKDLSEKEWVLLIGDHPLPEETDCKLLMNGFSLVRAPCPRIVDFNKSSWPGVIAKASGFYPNETWGTWSAGDVTLEFVKPLPEKFTVRFWAFTYGPYVGRKFVAHVGKASQSFTLGTAATGERVIEFNNQERANKITFDIPATLSPKSIGLSDDDRILGIAFSRLTIFPLSMQW